MNLPKSWNNITVMQYKELRGLGTPVSFFDWHLDVLDILTDVDVEDLTFDEVDKAFDGLKWLKREPHKVYSKNLGEYVCKEFKDVRFGEFLDLEYYFEKGKDEHMETISAIFYRKHKENEWGNSIVEPYEYDPIERGKEFSNLPITAIYGLVEKWVEHRNYLINDAYSNLFDGGELSEEEMEGLTPEEKAELLKEEADQKRFSRWAWESIVDSFAQGDKTKYKDVYNLKLIFVLNQLSKEVETK